MKMANTENSEHADSKHPYQALLTLGPGVLGSAVLGGQGLLSADKGRKELAKRINTEMYWAPSKRIAPNSVNIESMTPKRAPWDIDLPASSSVNVLARHPDAKYLYNLPPELSMNKTLPLESLPAKYRENLNKALVTDESLSRALKRVTGFPGALKYDMGTVPRNLESRDFLGVLPLVLGGALIGKVLDTIRNTNLEAKKK